MKKTSLDSAILGSFTPKIIFTGYAVDPESGVIYHEKNNQATNFWINNKLIFGKKPDYSLDERGIILFQGKNTHFYIQDNKIFGISKTLPWEN